VAEGHDVGFFKFPTSSLRAPYGRSTQYKRNPTSSLRSLYTIFLRTPCGRSPEYKRNPTSSFQSLSGFFNIKEILRAHYELPTSALMIFQFSNILVYRIFEKFKRVIKQTPIFLRAPPLGAKPPPLFDSYFWVGITDPKSRISRSPDTSVHLVTVSNTRHTTHNTEDIVVNGIHTYLGSIRS